MFKTVWISLAALVGSCLPVLIEPTGIEARFKASTDNERVNWQVFNNHAIKTEIYRKGTDLVFKVSIVDHTNLAGYTGPATPQFLEVRIGDDSIWFPLGSGADLRIPLARLEGKRRFGYRVHGTRAGASAMEHLMGQWWAVR